MDTIQIDPTMAHRIKFFSEARDNLSQLVRNDCSAADLKRAYQAMDYAALDLANWVLLQTRNDEVQG